jgi:cytochrome c oxidase assembly protein subunit 11
MSRIEHSEAMSVSTPESTRSAQQNRRVAFAAASVALAMVALAYASVPLYRLFCQATGFAGTTQRADQAPAAATNREMTIRFDANTAASLPWSFHPEQLELTVKVGEQNLAFYKARNLSDRALNGSAVFNVTPGEAGAYFTKVDCFCFTEQKLGPGESMDMPVAFFVDPKIADDPDLRSLTTITLSYTFYPADEGTTVSSASPEAEAVTR